MFLLRQHLHPQLALHLGLARTVPTQEHHVIGRLRLAKLRLERHADHARHIRPGQQRPQHRHRRLFPPVLQRLGLFLLDERLALAMEIINRPRPARLAERHQPFRRRQKERGPVRPLPRPHLDFFARVHVCRYVWTG